MEKGTRERTFGLLGRRSTEHELTGVSYHNGHTGTILLVCWHSSDALYYLVSTNYTSKDDMLAYEVKTDKCELVGEIEASVCAPFKWGHSLRVMKNWELLVFGPLFAMHNKLRGISGRVFEEDGEVN